jgi:hypothetical protein
MHPGSRTKLGRRAAPRRRVNTDPEAGAICRLKNRLRATSTNAQVGPVDAKASDSCDLPETGPFTSANSWFTTHGRTYSGSQLVCVPRFGHDRKRNRRPALERRADLRSGASPCDSVLHRARKVHGRG